MLERARRRKARTLKVRLTERALGRLERIAEKANATPEQLVERMVGDFVSSVGAAAARRRPHSGSPDEGPQVPGYA